MVFKNKYHCGTRIWRKFRWPARVVYNELYGAMIRSRELFEPHTKSYTKSLISKSDWAIIAHNAACEAAWAADKAAERLAA